VLLGSGPVADETTSVPELNLAEALQRGIGARLDRRFAGVHRRIYLSLVLLIAALAAGGSVLWLELASLKDELARVTTDATAAREQAAEGKARLDRLDRKLDDSLAETLRAIRAFADQTARLDKLSEKLDKNLADTSRAIRSSADQTGRLDNLGEKLDKSLADTMRAIQESGHRVETTVSTVAATRTTTFAAMTLSEEERETIRKFFAVRKKSDAVGFEAKVGEIAPGAAPLYPVPSLLYDHVPKIKDHRFFADEAEGTIILVRPEDNRIVGVI
jgi:methyl-accepting chemotaxis protein